MTDETFPEVRNGEEGRFIIDDGNAPELILLDHERGIFDDERDPAVCGYNILPIEQQLKARFIDQEEPGLSMIEMLRPGNDRKAITVEAMEIKSFFGYQSGNDGKYKPFRVFLVTDTEYTHPIIQPGRLLCMKENDPFCTVRFVKKAAAASGHAVEILAALTEEQRQLLRERLSATLQDLAGSPSTYQELMDRLTGADQIQ